MKYYKIIYDNQIIGVVSSKNFVQYIPVAECFARCDETKGEYISYSGTFYRDVWMNPTKIDYEFIEAHIVGITKEEYDILYEAFKTNEELVIEDDTEQESPVAPIIVDPTEEISIEFVRSSKIAEMSYACRTTIEAGIDIELRGEAKHFSLDTQDQLNLISLSAMAQTQSLIPYHADGEECTFYTSEEINEIVETATAYKIYHTTYYNALKTYINALGTIEEIAAITYGVEIPDEYKSDVLKVLEQ